PPPTPEPPTQQHTTRSIPVSAFSNKPQAHTTPREPAGSIELRPQPPFPRKENTTAGSSRLGGGSTIQTQPTHDRNLHHPRDLRWLGLQLPPLPPPCLSTTQNLTPKKRTRKPQSSARDGIIC
ncbi:unnamed protein product, partial [Ectocarpus fasciculatus]